MQSSSSVTEEDDGESIPLPPDKKDGTGDAPEYACRRQLVRVELRTRGRHVRRRYRILKR